MSNSTPVARLPAMPVALVAAALLAGCGDSGKRSMKELRATLISRSPVSRSRLHHHAGNPAPASRSTSRSALPATTPGAVVKTGDAAAWGPLPGARPRRLTASAIAGKERHAPRGGGSDLTDTEVKRAVAHLANLAGASHRAAGRAVIRGLRRSRRPDQERQLPRLPFLRLRPGLQQTLSRPFLSGRSKPPRSRGFKPCRGSRTSPSGSPAAPCLLLRHRLRGLAVVHADVAAISAMKRLGSQGRNSPDLRRSHQVRLRLRWARVMPTYIRRRSSSTLSRRCCSGAAAGLLDADQEHMRKLQALGGVQRPSARRRVRVSLSSMDISAMVWVISSRFLPSSSPFAAEPADLSRARCSTWIRPRARHRCSNSQAS